MANPKFQCTVHVEVSNAWPISEQPESTTVFTMRRTFEVYPHPHALTLTELVRSTKDNAAHAAAGAGRVVRITDVIVIELRG